MQKAQPAHALGLNAGQAATLITSTPGADPTLLFDPVARGGWMLTRVVHNDVVWLGGGATLEDAQRAGRGRRRPPDRVART